MSTSAKILTPEQQSALAKFQAFAGQQAAPKEIPTLTDYQGKTYGGDVLARLAGQISQNLDTSKLRGGAFGVNVDDDTSIGFSASEAKKLLGRMPTAPEMVILDMARGLASQGITDISDLGKYKPTEVEETVEGEGAPTTQKVTKRINPETGKEFTSGFGATYTGKGGTGYNVEFDSEGKPKFYTSGINTSDAGKIMPLLMMATLPFGGIGGLLSGVTGTAGVTGVAGAALGELGINTAGSGLAGTLASAGLPSFAADAAAKALVSGVASGGLGKLTGQPFSKGFKTGVTSSLASDVIGAGINKVAPDMFKGLGSLGVPAKSLATSALTAAARGKPFDLGQAVKGAAINYGLNQAIGAGGKELGIDPKQQAAMMKFYNFAAPMIAAQRRKP
jgi:hypothetical protein